MHSQDPAAADVIEIRKYPNRRYYDSSRSRHLTLDDIRQLIQQGRTVRITDSQSGADITASVLTQIILEFDPLKLDLLSAPLLMEIIRVNDQVIKGYFEKFFRQALDSFFAFQRQLEEQIRRGSVLPNLFPPLSAWYDQWTVPGPERSGASSPQDMAKAMSELQKEVEHLRQELPKTRRRRSGK